MRIRRHVSLTLDKELIRQIDELRGYITRSLYIELLLRKALQEMEEVERPPEVTAGASGGFKEVSPRDEGGETRI
ncbi:MAG: ribbon-helix-helix domain-containing protein [Candidatus Bathyarchaeia archaeon]